MAILRNSSQSLYNIGEKPPFVNWTVVRGDTSGFKVYLEDDSKAPLVVPDWDISMRIKRPNVSQLTPVITDDATEVLELFPLADADDLLGEFTVFLASSESLILQTGDIFDIQVSNGEIVWTVCQGSMIILEDVTD
jgi:hypothetical protein